MHLSVQLAGSRNSVFVCVWSPRFAMEPRCVPLRRRNVACDELAVVGGGMVCSLGPSIQEQHTAPARGHCREASEFSCTFSFSSYLTENEGSRSYSLWFRMRCDRMEMAGVARHLSERHA
ncbi:hypothetical protein ABB37_06749 [Leptomonas pyrrhocoris]|uniref:Uncharacterized protein n=1 Tax=Leptomonas pyrrhocoris TaxID=157538 RepID=A0A0M9FXM3_LEPPY|nr:hypothetical protein ABB37_06731 [Leptomonas pyrrhocoris]XP_015656408.1 hypothetical protein ABB37_06737 [Leptomonas pyrrhocoris]XP_015656415.1 hypothetical protein ABB37_06743 [Leptomonas pyrrhocoris]XP_015656423.1 hypothetical protein ABB37_06749 [Leptomonas pyrrhocoris]KPA77962.1 hypothetical protein ABB37_06731 [Leptomonas pyrrhocoris]KPA77969.1 hypothetical protein ABB37_06737 [Leptomonas pyrrhocoris]KPA77976.1 hypothetical protein ABB37_06743 [Leptomonas pyrrhocoris]KPA77984.1 hypot|eukprot:XP_015656401.1 hypothetical protein ABB37_06731 [Leptomonas pyrrhocoris]